MLLPIARVLCMSALLAFALSSQAEAFDIMLDASGSMQGFVGNGINEQSFRRLFDELQAEGLKGGGKITLFGDKPVPFSGKISSETFNHQKTNLAEAVSEWSSKGNRSEPLLIITDNVADGTDSEKTTNKNFTIQWRDLVLYPWLI